MKRAFRWFKSHLAGGVVTFAMCIAPPLLAAPISAQERSQRVQFAEELRDEVTKLNQLIPNLTPDQERYLLRERAEIDGIEDEGIKNRRLVTYAQTKEYQIDMIKKKCRDGLSWLTLIIDANPSQEFEVLAWMNVVSVFMMPGNVNGALDRLRELGVISSEDLRMLKYPGVGYGWLLSIRVQRVVDEILIPLQERKLAQGKGKAPKTEERKP